jgi:hypothetical protein
MRFQDLNYFDSQDIFFLANCTFENADSDYSKHLQRKKEAAIKHIESLSLNELSKELHIRKMLPEFFDTGIPSQKAFLDIYDSHYSLKYYLTKKLPYSLTKYLLCGHIGEYFLSNKSVIINLPKVATDLNKYQEKHLEREIGFLEYYLNKGYFFELSFSSSKEEYEESVKNTFPETEATKYLNLLFENTIVDKECINSKPSGQIAFDDAFDD